jgi:hypothetical protein
MTVADNFRLPRFLRSVGPLYLLTLESTYGIFHCLSH